MKEYLNPTHKKALILGSGGASKAVAYALEKLNVSSIIISRKKDNYFLNYNELTEDIIKENKLIINTTPLGMYPKTNEMPKLPYKFINNKHILFDLIYNPISTKFLLEGKKQGAKTLNGEKMLKFQAEKSWKIFNL